VPLPLFIHILQVAFQLKEQEQLLKEMQNVFKLATDSILKSLSSSNNSSESADWPPTSSESGLHYLTKVISSLSTETNEVNPEGYMCDCFSDVVLRYARPSRADLS
jgi:hypothetical protein